MNHRLELKKIEKLVKIEGFEFSLDILELLFFKYQILEKSKKNRFFTRQEFLEVEDEIELILLKIETLFKSLRELKKE